MWSAIQKYGWDSFEHSVIANGLTQEDANSLERQFIQTLRANDRRFGYNIQEGGRSAGGMSPEGLEHYRSIRSGDKASNARSVAAFDLSGKRIATFACTIYAADAFGIKRSTLLTHLSKGKGTCDGKIFKYVDDVGDLQQLCDSDIYKPHENRSIRGASNYLSKGVCIYDLDGKFLLDFGSVAEAATYVGVTVTSLAENLRRGTGTCGNKIARYSSEHQPGIDLHLSRPAYFRESPSRRKPVQQYSLDGEFISEYESITEASKATGLTVSQISQCVRMKRNRAGEFKWKYA